MAVGMDKTGVLERHVSIRTSGVSIGERMVLRAVGYGGM